MMKTTNAAIVWLRYRAKYGHSPLEVLRLLNAGDPVQALAAVARLYSEMLLDGFRHSPEELLATWAKDIAGYRQALECVLTLHDGHEPHMALHKTTSGGGIMGKEPPPYDEYSLLARFAMAGLPDCLLYELPYMAIEVVLNRHAALQPRYEAKNGDGVTRRAATDEEIRKFHGL